VRCDSARRSTQFSRCSRARSSPLAEGIEHLRDAERLQQEVAGAGAQRLDRGVEVGEGGDQHHLAGSNPACAQVLQQLDAADARQRDVEDHQVEAVALQQRIGFLGRAGGNAPGRRAASAS
jgi:hypothetical protein